MKLVRATLAVVASFVLVVAGWSRDQPDKRPQANPDAPTVMGKVVAYEMDKSITIETPQRGGEAKKTEFSIVKDKTKIELPSRVKTISVGMTIAVWADKENPKVAAKLGIPVSPGAGVRRPEK